MRAFYYTTPDWIYAPPLSLRPRYRPSIEVIDYDGNGILTLNHWVTSPYDYIERSLIHHLDAGRSAEVIFDAMGNPIGNRELGGTSFLEVLSAFLKVSVDIDVMRPATTSLPSALLGMSRLAQLSPTPKHLHDLAIQLTNIGLQNGTSGLPAEPTPRHAAPAPVHRAPR